MPMCLAWHLLCFCTYLCWTLKELDKPLQVFDGTNCEMCSCELEDQENDNPLFKELYPILNYIFPCLERYQLASNMLDGGCGHFVTVFKPGSDSNNLSLTQKNDQSFENQIFAFWRCLLDVCQYHYLKGTRCSTEMKLTDLGSDVHRYLLSRVTSHMFPPPHLVT